MTGPRLLAAALLVAAGLAAPAAGAQPRTVGWVLTRTRNVPTVIEGRFEAWADSEESAVTMFALAGSGAGRHVDYRFTTTSAHFGADAWPQVHVDGLPAVACPAACTSPVGFRMGLYVSSQGRAISSTVYIAAHGLSDAILRITTPGWTVRRWTPGRRAIGSGTTGTSVGVAHHFAGTYRGGSLPGGAYGSFAWAWLPCGDRGWGHAVLTGGPRPHRMECGISYSAFDSARRGTTWRVTGEVTGYGPAAVLLEVVDFPKG